MITLIDRTQAKPVDWVLTESSLDAIRAAHQKEERVLVYLNRRWAFRAYICEDCSHEWRCPHCDVALTFHTSPNEKLLCHHCGFSISIPSICPKCQGYHLRWVGTGLQEVERFLTKHLQIPLSRIDSDASKNTSSHADITLATEFVLREHSGKIDLLIILTPEAELAIPEYNIEERVYAHFRYLMQESSETIIETSIPKSDFIQNLVHGNYKDFLVRTLEERKRYNYPPYTGIAYLEIREKNPERLSLKTATFVNKLEILQEDIKKSGEIMFDTSMRKKRAWEWIDTIVIRSDNIEYFVQNIEKEILKNRWVFLEIRWQKIF